MMMRDRRRNKIQNPVCFCVFFCFVFFFRGDAGESLIWSLVRLVKFFFSFFLFMVIIMYHQYNRRRIRNRRKKKKKKSRKSIETKDLIILWPAAAIGENIYLRIVMNTFIHKWNIPAKWKFKKFKLKSIKFLILPSSSPVPTTFYFFSLPYFQKEKHVACASGPKLGRARHKQK